MQMRGRRSSGPGGSQGAYLAPMRPAGVGMAFVGRAPQEATLDVGPPARAVPTSLDADVLLVLAEAREPFSLNRDHLAASIGLLGPHVPEI